MTDIIITIFQVAAIGFLTYGALLTGTTPRVMNARRERQEQTEGLTETV